MANTGSERNLSIIDGLSQSAVGFFRRRSDFFSRLDISYGPHVIHYVHEGLYASVEGNNLVSNPESLEGLLPVWEARDAGQPVYGRTIGFPVGWGQSLQPDIRKRLGKEWNEERVKIEDRLYQCYSDGVVRIILLEGLGLLRITTAENIEGFDEFFGKYPKVAKAANMMYPWLESYLQK